MLKSRPGTNQIPRLCTEASMSFGSAGNFARKSFAKPCSLRNDPTHGPCLQIWKTLHTSKVTLCKENPSVFIDPEYQLANKVFQRPSVDSIDP